MKLSISKIKETAKDRPSGYLEDVLSSGVIEGDELEISSEVLAALRMKYRPPLPSLTTMAATMSRALVSETVAVVMGVPPVSEAMRETRLAACQGCDAFDSNQQRCRHCGCVVELKSRLRTAHCPSQKW